MSLKFGAVVGSNIFDYLNLIGKLKSRSINNVSRYTQTNARSQ